jgi:hypothetical protein
MRDPLPTVLFVDEDETALHRILVKIEPLYSVFSLRSTSQLFRYIQRIEPEVLVLSDKLEFRKRELRFFIPLLRQRFHGKIVVLTDNATDGARAFWKEVGADDCCLHPTRERSRIDSLSRRIIDLAAELSVQCRDPKLPETGTAS